MIDVDDVEPDYVVMDHVEGEDPARSEAKESILWKFNRRSLSMYALNRLLQFAWCAALVAVPISAQWLDYPTPGIPRTKDGKPNLSAPTPKDASGKPDLSGIWVKERSPWEPPESAAGTPNSMAYYMPPGSSIAMKPAAAALYKQRYEVQQGAGRPSERCLPHSIPDQMFIGVPLQLVQTKGFTIMLWEEFTHYRMIYTDGRTHPKDPNPTWFGYSIGSWNGDTFAVDTRGFNDKSWLDDGGHPHTEAMHTIEKFRRPDFGHLKVEVTIDDPGAYEKPVTLFVNFRYLADTILIESICDNEKDAQHQVGKQSR